MCEPDTSPRSSGEGQGREPEGPEQGGRERGWRGALAGAGADSSWTPAGCAHGSEMSSPCQETAWPLLPLSLSSPRQAPTSGALKQSPQPSAPPEWASPPQNPGKPTPSPLLLSLSLKADETQARGGENKQTSGGGGRHEEAEDGLGVPGGPQVQGAGGRSAPGSCVTQQGAKSPGSAPDGPNEMQVVPWPGPHLPRPP